MRVVLIASAGAAGAVCRYLVSSAVGQQRFPWATLGINVIGSFVLGVVLTTAASRQWPVDVTAAVAVGFVGAFTTYSTFSWEAVTLGRTGRFTAALVYVGASLALGLAAAYAGVRLARTFTS